MVLDDEPAAATSRRTSTGAQKGRRENSDIVSSFASSFLMLLGGIEEGTVQEAYRRSGATAGARLLGVAFLVVGGEGDDCPIPMAISDMTPDLLLRS